MPEPGMVAPPGHLQHATAEEDTTELEPAWFTLYVRPVRALERDPVSL